jgi:hypothetical protein
MNPEEEKDKALWRKQTYEQFKAELEANPTLQALLERCYPNARKGFIEEYAHHKVNVVEYGEYHRQWLEREDLQWVNKANYCLDQILQKKLFDAQCLWRAEQMDIAEVDVTKDFLHWQNNVRACPFIDPIEQADVDLYMQYLESSNFQMELDLLEQWQDHDEIAKSFRDEPSFCTMPQWYEFHNNLTGLGIYLSLPDIRKQKEEVYLDLWRSTLPQPVAPQKKTWGNVKAVNPGEAIPPDQLPYLNFSKDSWMKWFVETYEDQETQAAFRSNQKMRDDNSFDDEMHESLEILARADRKVPMQAWYDWKEAVYRSVDWYSRIRIAEAMPEAFEQYRLHIDLGLGFETNIDRTFGWNDGYRNAVLAGREMNGEPRDFNF